MITKNLEKREYYPVINPEIKAELEGAEALLSNIEKFLDPPYIWKLPTKKEKLTTDDVDYEKYMVRDNLLGAIYMYIDEALSSGELRNAVELSTILRDISLSLRGDIELLKDRHEMKDQEHMDHFKKTLEELVAILYDHINQLRLQGALPVSKVE